MTPDQPSVRAASRFTVIVPAHNEESVIAGTLRSMLEGCPAEQTPRVLVVCNGCSDATATAARAAATDAEVLEIAAASKTEAINHGLARTRDFPVIVVDADIAVDPESLWALVEALGDPGIMAASLAPRIDVAQSDRWTRAYYRVWQRDPYLSSGVGGSGVYGLSKAGVAQIGRFPPVIADDSFVRWSFALSEQRRVAHAGARPAFSRVVAPRNVADLLKCEVRWQEGHIQLRQLMTEPRSERRRVFARSEVPATADRLIHLAIKLAARVLYMCNWAVGRRLRWHRGARRPMALAADASREKNSVETSP